MEATLRCVLHTSAKNLSIKFHYANCRVSTTGIEDLQEEAQKASEGHAATSRHTRKVCSQELSLAYNSIRYYDLLPTVLAPVSEPSSCGAVAALKTGIMSQVEFRHRGWLATASLYSTQNDGDRRFWCREKPCAAWVSCCSSMAVDRRRSYSQAIGSGGVFRGNNAFCGLPMGLVDL